MSKISSDKSLLISSSLYWGSLFIQRVYIVNAHTNLGTVILPFSYRNSSVIAIRANISGHIGV